MKRIIIDTDPGIDDAHAIMLAYAQANTTVEALTTVAGNVPLKRATLNALIILEVLGKNTPVYAGCEDALVVPTPRRAISHGTDGLGDSGYPIPTGQASPEHAVNALIRLANESPGELTLIALGPLTNIAMATRLDPSLPQKYKQLVVMGGAIHAQGNSWERAAEFNFYCDPEAAAVVFSSWPGLTLVPWESCLASGLKPHQVDALTQCVSPRADLFRRTIRKRFLEVSGQRILSVPDPLAVAIALEPEIVLRAENHYIEIELAGRMTRGQTVVDWFNLTGHAPNCRVILEVNQEKFADLMKLSVQ